MVASAARACGLGAPARHGATKGFGFGLDEDGGGAALVRRRRARRVLVATSFSKNSRSTASGSVLCAVVCEQPREAQRVLSQLKVMIRANYSNPPTHGAQAVAAVLADPPCATLWHEELAQMRSRIRIMRDATDRQTAAQPA